MTHQPTTPGREGGDLDLIYDWDEEDALPTSPPTRSTELHDETLRDGLQGASNVQPPLTAKLDILHLLDQLKVDSVNVGLPAAGERAASDVFAACKEIASCGLGIRPTCAARTIASDIRPIVEVAQRTGLLLEVMSFIGTSPIRQFTEGWSPSLILHRAAQAIDFAVREQLEVTLVVEDATRTHPDLLRPLIHMAVDHGATRFCLGDTVGFASHRGVERLIRFCQKEIRAHGAVLAIDWHGHNDRGLALANALLAAEAGADRLHGCVLGLGERAGNAPLDLLLVNLQLQGAIAARDLSPLQALCAIVSESTAVPIPSNYPVLGDGVFRTATGVHASAIVKAMRKGSDWLADRVYSSIPASLVGRHQEICIGPWSGTSNVVQWLDSHGFAADPSYIHAILREAKASNHNLSDDELETLMSRLQPATHVAATPPSLD